ncbi:hypothetical protein [Methylorubrum sp. SL192]|uniref:hypothetical protein n=1 Tax=Methylorubrum sp. SL192 TaxID=2995167 RepID=UPI003FA3A7CE
MPGDGRGEVETVAVGVRVSGDARIGEVRIDRHVHLLVGDGGGFDMLQTRARVRAWVLRFLRTLEHSKNHSDVIERNGAARED